MSVYDGYCTTSHIPLLVTRERPVPIVASIKEDGSLNLKEAMELLERNISYENFVHKKAKGYISYCNLEWSDGSVYGWKCAGSWHSGVTGEVFDLIYSSIRTTLENFQFSRNPFISSPELGD